MTGLGNNGVNSSRLGFRGTEDLGGGLAASFHLEAAVFPDAGTGGAAGGGLDFQRRSTVSFQGRFSEIRVGRDFAPSVWNATAYDPFGTVGAGQNLMNGMLGIAAGVVPGTVAAPLRNSNSIAYFLPANAGGFFGQAQYAFGENSSSSVPATKAGNYAGFRFGYADGPVNVAVSHGQLQTGAAAYQGHTRATNFGGSYNFGMATAMAVWAREESRVAAVGSTLDAWPLEGTAESLGAFDDRVGSRHCPFSAGAPRRPPVPSRWPTPPPPLVLSPRCASAATRRISAPISWP